MLETAMLKVFASDQLWRIVNDTLQVWGGKGFFTDEPFERMMRDARLNQIGEGANDVLRCFIAMVGMRGLGVQLQQVTKKPWQVTNLLRFAPNIPVKHERLQKYASRLSKQIAKLANVSQVALIKHRETILDQQFIQARIGDMATELFLASCVYARLDSLMSHPHKDAQRQQRELATGELYWQFAEKRNQARLVELKRNFDEQQVDVADRWLGASELPQPGES
jgi:acyl-CoA dehydrogenase family protein 9